MTTGEFPELLKLVMVITILQRDSIQDVNNYRPISLFSIFDKIIEKIRHRQLHAFLEKHNVLHQNQFGFRKNNSTIYTRLKLQR